MTNKDKYLYFQWIYNSNISYMSKKVIIAEVDPDHD